MDYKGERVKKTRAGVTTVYLEGMWEEEVQTGVTRQVYTFNSDEVAQRTRATGKNEVVYLHNDHLGSVSVTTKADGTLAEQQLYDPWGRQRAGNLAQTSLDFTGQRRDDTGLELRLRCLVCPSPRCVQSALALMHPSYGACRAPLSTPPAAQGVLRTGTATPWPRSTQGRASAARAQEVAASWQATSPRPC